MKISKLLLLSSLVFVASNVSADRPLTGVSLPEVPVSVTDSKRKKRSPSVNMKSSQKPTLVSVTPGVTELVEVAQNYYNRIVTPFDNPKLITVNPIDFKKQGNVIFIQPGQKQPVGVYILPQDSNNDDRAISLALIPKKIPPKTINIVWSKPALKEQSLKSFSGNFKKAERWETSNNYEKTILRINTLLAKGDIPPGYELRNTSSAYSCDFNGLKVTVGQVLEGSQFKVLVAKAENITATGFMIVEESCFTDSVVSVAMWPRAYLEAGEKTEMYIVEKKSSRTSVQQSRRRLVN